MEWREGGGGRGEGDPLFIFTSPRGTTPTCGDSEMGAPSGMTNSKALGPWGRVTPLITALFSRLSLGLVRDTGGREEGRREGKERGGDGELNKRGRGEREEGGGEREGGRGKGRKGGREGGGEGEVKGEGGREGDPCTSGIGSITNSCGSEVDGSV